MSRISRMLRPDEPTIYHVISRSALPGFPLTDADKDQLVFLLRKFSTLFFVDVLGLCMMGNHVHLAVRVHPESAVDDTQIRERLEADRGEGAFISNLDIEAGRKNGIRGQVNYSHPPNSLLSTSQLHHSTPPAAQPR